ncbi:MAG: ABC transporter ATP-binding protein [Candidatus Omnitrophica bacterium]|nr:ABC transporter ATP-binding protein [Candidatus Omnitrophota bacterium]
MDNRERVISVRNLEKSFSGRKVLDGISLDIYKGETFVIMGGSGCGKTTLLRHLIGAMKPDKGHILYGSKDITTLSEIEIDNFKRKFGMLFQSAALLDSLNVEDNVSLPLKEHTKLDENIIKIIVKMKLALVGLRGFEKLMPSQLSGGMKKRVGLARAITMDPEIVFYDEPSAGLDPIVTAVIDQLIIDLSKKLLITSIVVTHDMNSVFRIADRIAMLHMGEIMEIGTREQIQNSTNPIVQQFIKGDTEGPLDFFKKGDDYLTELVE